MPGPVHSTMRCAVSTATGRCQLSRKFWRSSACYSARQPEGSLSFSNPEIELAPPNRPPRNRCLHLSEINPDFFSSPSYHQLLFPSLHSSIGVGISCISFFSPNPVQQAFVCSILIAPRLCPYELKPARNWATKTCCVDRFDRVLLRLVGRHTMICMQTLGFCISAAVRFFPPRANRYLGALQGAVWCQYVGG